VPIGLSLREQYDAGREALSSKWSTEKCIAYLQAHTNTYAPVEVLRGIYEEILTFPNLCGISIATRADCLGEDVCELLREVSERIPLTVELGLQSSSDVTAKRICRGHTMADFEEGYARLRQFVPEAEVCIHIIFGLPDESDADMMNTVRKVAVLEPEQVKIHLLHVIKDTPLADEYLRGEYIPLDRERYISLVAEALTLLPADTVICRLTGDGIAEDLLAPEYSKRKIAILNDIDKLMFASGATQGCKCQKNG
jgi:radical SAM protein (TIGR01212 family)